MCFLIRVSFLVLLITLTHVGLIKYHQYKEFFNINSPDYLINKGLKWAIINFHTIC